MQPPHSSAPTTHFCDDRAASNIIRHSDSSWVDNNGDRSLLAYDYELPQELIAQNPVTPRDSSRLLALDSPNSHSHRVFRDLPELLKVGDLLVLNNTRVIPARLYGCVDGALVEVLLLEERQPNVWLALVKPGKRFKIRSKIFFDSRESGIGKDARVKTDDGKLKILSAKVLATEQATGGRILEFDLPEETSLIEILEQFGCVPLPPYITNSQSEPEQYQTVYARHPGAVAAPTAGLHFTTELLDRLQARGIDRAYVTLHVGVGTFRPVEVEDVTTHKMHEEWVEVPAVTIAKIQETKARGGRIIAVGTTAVRALEGAAARTGLTTPFCGKTDLFIYPGYQWRVVQGLITNFHLPRSSLLMLVSAMVGRQRLLDLYREAIARQYRFYSFGDAMLILPEAK